MPSQTGVSPYGWRMTYPAGLMTDQERKLGLQRPQRMSGVKLIPKHTLAVVWPKFRLGLVVSVHFCVATVNLQVGSYQQLSPGQAERDGATTSDLYIERYYSSWHTNRIGPKQEAYMGD